MLFPAVFTSVAHGRPCGTSPRWQAPHCESHITIFRVIHFCCTLMKPSRGTIINSYVIQKLSWRLGFWFMSIACGICFIAVVLLVPEVSFHFSRVRTEWDNTIYLDNISPRLISEARFEDYNLERRPRRRCSTVAQTHFLLTDQDIQRCLL